MPQVGISASLPIYTTDEASAQNDTSLLGVVSVDIILSALDSRIAEYKFVDGESFIIDRDGLYVVGSPNITETPQLSLAVEYPVPVVKNAMASAVTYSGGAYRSLETMFLNTLDGAAVDPLLQIKVLLWDAGKNEVSVTKNRTIETKNIDYLIMVADTRDSHYQKWHQNQSLGLVVTVFTVMITLLVSRYVLERTSDIVNHIKGMTEGVLHMGNDEEMQGTFDSVMKQRRGELEKELENVCDLDEATRESLDLNGDGKLTSDEIQTYINHEIDLVEVHAISKSKDEAHDRKGANSHPSQFDLQHVYTMCSSMMQSYRDHLNSENLLLPESEQIDVDEKCRETGSQMLILGCKHRVDIVSLFQHIIHYGERHVVTKAHLMFNTRNYRHFFVYPIICLLNAVSFIQDNRVGGVARDKADYEWILPGGTLSLEGIIILAMWCDAFQYLARFLNDKRIDDFFQTVISDMQAASDSSTGRQRKWSFYTHAKVGIYSYVFLVLLMTVDYFICLADSQDDFRYALFIRPVLLLLRVPLMWRYVYLLATAMFSVKQALYLYLSVLLIASCQSMTLFRGLYDTGDYSTDGEFKDFYHAFLTMFIYTSTGENFNEAVNPALAQSMMYGWFFIFYTAVGMFFVTSLVVAIFQKSYDKEQGLDNTPKLTKWAGMCCCFAAWATEEAPADEHDGRPRLDLDSFLGIMETCYPELVKGVEPDLPENSPFYEFPRKDLSRLFHFLDCSLDDPNSAFDPVDSFNNLVGRGEAIVTECRQLKDRFAGTVEAQAIGALSEVFAEAMQMESEVTNTLPPTATPKEEVVKVRKKAAHVIEEARWLERRMRSVGRFKHARELEELVEGMSRGMRVTKEVLETKLVTGVLRIEEFENLNDVLVVMHNIAANENLLAHVVRSKLKLDIAGYAEAGEKIPDAFEKQEEAERSLSAIDFRIEALEHLEDRKLGNVLKLAHIGLEKFAIKVDEVRQITFVFLFFHLFSFALYGTVIEDEHLNKLQMFFPPLFLLEILFDVFVLGLEEFWYCNRARDRVYANRIDVVVVLIQAAVWFKWLISGSYDARGQGDLFLLSLGTVRIVTSSTHFRKIFYVLSHSIYCCGPIGVTLAVVVMFYATFSLWLFRDKNVLSGSGHNYFDGLGACLFTHFQLFIGEGWHDIMYATVNKYDGTVVYIFVTYVIFVTVLFGNLFLGVIINIYNEVDTVDSINLHETLEISFQDMSSEQRNKNFRLLCDLLEELEMLPDPFGPLQQIHLGNTNVSLDEKYYGADPLGLHNGGGDGLTKHLNQLREDSLDLQEAGVDPRESGHGDRSWIHRGAEDQGSGAADSGAEEV